MRKTSSGLGIGLWVVGGAVGGYLLVFCLTAIDLWLNEGRFLSALPFDAVPILETIYAPILEIIGHLS